MSRVMPKRPYIRIQAFAFVALLSASVCADNIDFGRYYALLIANEEYKEWKPLSTPNEDVDELAKLLGTQYGFNVRVIRDVTRDNIIDELESLKEKLTDRDNLLIYFAGHGKLRNDGGFWVGVDASKKSRSRWLHYDTISQLLDVQNGMRARHVLVIADSCYSGAVFRDDAEVVEKSDDVDRATWLQRINKLRSRSALTSGGTEPVIDQSGGAKHSIFAAELIDKLRSNQDVLEASRLYGKIKVQVHARAKRFMGSEAQAPEYGQIHATGHQGGDFLFIPKGYVHTEVAISDPTYDNVVIRGETDELTPRVSRPSFDCGKASTPQEVTICANGDVANADYHMGQAYRTLRARLDEPQKSRLRQEQIEWISKRDQKCSAPIGLADCLRDETIQRLKVLRAML